MLPTLDFIFRAPSESPCPVGRDALRVHPSARRCAGDRSFTLRPRHQQLCIRVALCSPFATGTCQASAISRGSRVSMIKTSIVTVSDADSPPSSRLSRAAATPRQHQIVDESHRNGDESRGSERCRPDRQRGLLVQTWATRRPATSVAATCTAYAADTVPPSDNMAPSGVTKPPKLTWPDS